MATSTASRAGGIASGNESTSERSTGGGSSGDGGGGGGGFACVARSRQRHHVYRRRDGCGGCGRGGCGGGGGGGNGGGVGGGGGTGITRHGLRTYARCTQRAEVAAVLGGDARSEEALQGQLEAAAAAEVAISPLRLDEAEEHLCAAEVGEEGARLRRLRRDEAGALRLDVGVDLGRSCRRRAAGLGEEGRHVAQQGDEEVQRGAPRLRLHVHRRAVALAAPRARAAGPLLLLVLPRVLAQPTKVRLQRAGSSKR